MKYSVVVPLYNEAESVQQLHAQIYTTLQKMGESFEIIFVNDASTDQTTELCRRLTPLTLLVLQKNSGQTAAMDAGIKQAQGEYIITLDGDLQNDPQDIPKLVNYLETQKLDVVSGWRKQRKDPFLKKFISRGANFLRQLLIRDDIHDSGCSLKVYKRSCFETIDLYGEMHRFIPALLKIKGFTIGECEVNHFSRKYGKTKYTWRRTVKGFLDMLSVCFWQKYVNRPMHLLGGIGIVFWVLGTITVGMSVLRKIFGSQDLSDNALFFIGLFFFFFGLNFLVMGVLFDISARTYYSSTKDKPYIVQKKFENT